MLRLMACRRRLPRRLGHAILIGVVLARTPDRRWLTMKQLAALGLAALVLAACERGDSAAHDATPAPKSVARPIPTPAAPVNLAAPASRDREPPLPTGVDPDNPYAVFAARAAAAKSAESRGGARIDYGVLGDPLDEPLDWESTIPTSSARRHDRSSTSFAATSTLPTA
jgi:hypothetical protein